MVCYQSRVGPLEWIEPATDAEIRRAGASDKRALVVCPIAFVSEHSETLVELDIEYRHLAEQNGAPAYVRVPTVATHPAFIGGLASAGAPGDGRDAGGAGRGQGAAFTCGEHRRRCPPCGEGGACSRGSRTLYGWIKALHVIAVIAWMAGMLYLPRLFVYHADAKPGSELSETLKVMERRLLRAIINPAMGAAWIFGLGMAGATSGASIGSR